MKIAIGCDHGALDYKNTIRDMLKQQGHEVIDCGTHTEDSCDYPIYGKAVADAVAQGQVEKGIVICGTGIGISIAANKVNGVRCSLCHDVTTARLTREHNDSNVLAMGARVIGIEVAKDIVHTYLETPFSNGDRHIKRLEMISEIEKEN